MYPLAFTNPNGPPPRRVATNHNVRNEAVASTPNTATQLLVVESRVSDRWSVILCCGLDELDDALDCVRTQHTKQGIDEVCLMLEHTGTQGRQCRREILRFTPSASREPASPPIAQPPSASELRAQPDEQLFAYDAPRPSHTLTKTMLMAASALALLVLGGALSELLAVDITPAANAGTGELESLILSGSTFKP